MDMGVRAGQFIEAARLATSLARVDWAGHAGARFPIRPGRESIVADRGAAWRSRTVDRYMVGSPISHRHEVLRWSLTLRRRSRGRGGPRRSGVHGSAPAPETRVVTLGARYARTRSSTRHLASHAPLPATVRRPVTGLDDDIEATRI